MNEFSCNVFFQKSSDVVVGSVPTKLCSNVKINAAHEILYTMGNFVKNNKITTFIFNFL